MAMLHIVNKSPFERNALKSCLAHALAGDAVLLIEDAVIGAVSGTSLASELQAAMSEQAVSIYALGPDLSARGVSEQRMLDGIQVVDYAGFVDLTVANEKTQSWL
ncbi:sulfurtransferase complex subunit TusB [Thiothrix eikelboomii]|uniref:tRNA 2-thiouridine synthesizing protein B n=1 Tax=Thiothrix eikelboomii TaxID=92487 RepID=A0A1T4X764_9GAMM|nr:sulfurtransferase complex subunit TusB [Thiothrix eikelboomii]SKA85386.1 tRNA 2-thiouridine synthesizing protein B [Thiothrix eikelboomii]